VVWRYVKLQLFVFICGIIGPIYLIGYFMFVPQSDRHGFLWMYWAGLLITVADVLVALVITRYRAKSAAKVAALEASGELALAQITGMQGTGMEINDQPVLKLDLRITGPEFAFDSQKRVTVGVARMGNINARKLVVLVDPAAFDYEVDWERSALVNGLVPATFTLSEDNSTYDLSGQAGPLMEILQILKVNKIPLTNPLDLRKADQAMRRQLQDVVRQAAAAQRSPSFAAGPGAATDPPGFAPPRPSAAQRLQELAGLHANEAITDDEYAERRRQIISEI
jgi:hypothetical protein